MQTFEAALTEANALHKAGRLPEAVARYETLLRQDPNHAKILYYTGAAYAGLGRLGDALASLERSLAHAPKNLDTIEMLGSTWMQAGQPENALAYFREAAALSARPEAQIRLATVLMMRRHHAEALPLLEDLRARGINDAQIELGRALCLAETGKTAEAENALRACIAAWPDAGKAHIALGNLLAQQGRFAEAEDVARARLAVHTDAEALRLLANILHRQGRLSEAEGMYRQTLQTHPNDVRTLCQLGEALIDLHRLDDAETELKHALTIQPADAGSLTAMGRIHELRGALTDALALHDRALALEPRDDNALVNRGATKRFLGDFDGALVDYDSALAIRPGHPPALASRALALLTLGRLAEAWPTYRARIKAQGGALDFAGTKPWDGTTIAGKKVLAWTEYGLGDEILFASLLPEVAAAAAHCTLVCSPRLVGILARSFPNVTVVPWDAELGDSFDVRVPLTDLAQLFRPSLASFPAHEGYLRADPARAAALRARYAGATDRPVVGISWRSAAGPTGRFKSTDLAQWAEILRTPGVSFVSLQYGDCRDDIARAKAVSGAEIIVDPAIDTMRDIEAFAAQVAAMDLVISVSNTTVHMAGALGRPTWVLTPTGPGMHWYWLRNRADSVWYPSLRLFRQSTAMDWSGALAAVATELRTRFEA